MGSRWKSRQFSCKTSRVSLNNLPQHEVITSASTLQIAALQRRLYQKRRGDDHEKSDLAFIRGSHIPVIRLVEPPSKDREKHIDHLENEGGVAEIIHVQGACRTHGSYE